MPYASSTIIIRQQTSVINAIRAHCAEFGIVAPVGRVVRDHNGQQLAHVYYEDEPERRSAAKLLTKDEARRIAANEAKLRHFLSLLSN